MRMQAIDAGVDHRPHDFLAESPERVARRICLDRGDGPVRQRLDLEIRPDLVDRTRRTSRCVAFDQRLDALPAQAAEHVLLAVFALERVNPNFGRVVDLQLFQEADDPIVGLGSPTRKIEVEIDDHLMLGCAPATDRELVE